MTEIDVKALDRQAGEWGSVANLLFAAATVSMSRAESMDSNTDKRHGEACVRVARLLLEARDG